MIGWFLKVDGGVGLRSGPVGWKTWWMFSGRVAVANWPPILFIFKVVATVGR